MRSVKDEITSMLDRLPEDASFEDVQYHLYVVEKVRNGLETAKTDGTVTQEQAEEKLKKWLIS